MLDFYYITEQPLPLDPQKIARLIGMRDQIKEVSDVLSDFFLKSEKGWVNQRCEEEIAAYTEKANRARKANKARWDMKSDLISDVKSDLISDADQIPTNPTPTPTPRKEKRRAILDKPKRPARQSFDEWWQTEILKSPAYHGIHLERELSKMKVWLAKPENQRRKLTTTFAVNWLNRIEPVSKVNSHAGRQPDGSIKVAL